MYMRIAQSSLHMMLFCNARMLCTPLAGKNVDCFPVAHLVQGIACCINLKGCGRTENNYKLTGSSQGKEFTPLGDTDLFVCNAHRQALAKGKSIGQTKDGQAASTLYSKKTMRTKK